MQPGGSYLDGAKKQFIFVVIATMLLLIVAYYHVSAKISCTEHLITVKNKPCLSNALKRMKRTQVITDCTGQCHVNVKNPCLRNAFKDTVLVMNFNYPFYGNTKILHELYDDVFGVVSICGPPAESKSDLGPDILYNEEEIWYYRYRCLSKAMQKYPGYSGYMYSNDDIIINWWNLLKLDRSKIWQSGFMDFRQQAYGPILNKDWVWWELDVGLKACQKYYEDLKLLAQTTSSVFKNALDIYLANGQGVPRCAKGWTDMFYVPGKFAEGYIKLSDIAYKNKLFLEIAGNNIIRSLDSTNNFEFLNGTYLPDIGIRDLSAESLWKTYNLALTFIHPVKLNSAEKDFTLTIIRNWIIHYKNTLISC